MRTFALVATLAVIAVLAISAVALAGDRRPMSGRFTVAVVPVDQRCGPNAFTIGFEGAGVATHLGRMKGSGANCTELALARESVAVWDGVATFIAADGSTLTAAYAGEQEQPQGGRAVAVTTNTVVSATGRFADATGSWTTVGVIDFATGTFSGSLSGWLSF
jgi:hypothetical protein